MNTAVIGLGSNIRPQKNIQKANELMTKHFAILAESKFAKTKPIGKKNQPDFLNGAILIRTKLGFKRCKTLLKSIEQQLGRKRNALDPFGPREIDLDLIIWNNKIIHNDLRERAYLKKSVNEILKTNYLK